MNILICWESKKDSLYISAIWSILDLKMNMLTKCIAQVSVFLDISYIGALLKRPQFLGDLNVTQMLVPGF